MNTLSRIRIIPKYMLLISLFVLNQFILKGTTLTFAKKYIIFEEEDVYCRCFVFLFSAEYRFHMFQISVFIILIKDPLQKCVITIN